MDKQYSAGPLDLWRLAGIPLVVTTLGAAIPYGEGDTTSNNLTTWEWVLTGMFAIAFIVLLISMLWKKGNLLSLGYLLTGFAWMVNTIYEFLTENNTFLDSLGRGLTSLGIGLAALAIWRGVQVARGASTAPHEHVESPDYQPLSNGGEQ